MGMVQEIHSRVKAHTTTSRLDLVTSNYHDLLHKRLLQPLQRGSVKECAAGLFAYGLSREFFTDQAPALRKPLQLDDPYTKVEGKNKTLLLEELKLLNQAIQAQEAVKRKLGKGEAGGDDNAA